MIKVRITTPYRTMLTEAAHVDVALYGKDDKIQLVVGVGLYVYSVHIGAADEAAAADMGRVYQRIKTDLNSTEPGVEIQHLSNGTIQMRTTYVLGVFTLEIGGPETSVVVA